MPPAPGRRARSPRSAPSAWSRAPGPGRRRSGRAARRRRPAAAISAISPGSIMPEDTSCASGSTVPMPDELEAAPLGHVEDLAHAALRQQHLAILGRVGEERHRHHVGLRPGLLGQPVHHVVGVGGVVAGQPAEQRDEAHAAARRAAAAAGPRRPASGRGRGRSPGARRARSRAAGSRRPATPSARSGRPGSPRSGATSQDRRPKRADEPRLELDALDDARRRWSP